jgi:hypothetical protein
MAVRCTPELPFDVEALLRREGGVGSVEQLTFASKIDGWLLVVLLGSALACLFAAGSIMLSQMPGPWWIAALLVLIGCVLPVWLLVATSYVLTATTLDVRSGPFKWRVAIAEVTDISPTRNPVSSPALSLDRIRIDYGDGRWIIVSPREKERFVRELEQRRARVGGH